ncbi:hypothetical protein [Streptomyces sp. FxanaA7]|uniref:hypothetical protein n=1 Tax=Streptomyces sp. FxanaA7 TaxID=1265492 RepID=UPI000A7E4480|nr:hypothetical protein [Streptomyces sp. FxanaA7]
MMIAPPRPRGTTPQGDDVKRGEDPYKATPPPWQGWPPAETSRRRRRIALLVPLVGAAGCGLLVLLGIGLSFGLVILSGLALPVPGGKPLTMSTAGITGTWVDEGGGRLVLKEDGTFTSTEICGDFDDNDDDGFDDVLAPNPGTGTWERDTRNGVGTDDPVSTVHLTFTPSGVRGTYETRGTKKNPNLWTYIGDPDEKRLCMLERAETSG